MTDNEKITAEVLFGADEDGILIEYREPYMTVEFKTPQDYEYFKELINKSHPKSPIEVKRTALDYETGECRITHHICEHIEPYSHEYTYNAYECPTCKKLISDGTPNYCSNCGQALDWSVKQ